MYTVIVTPVHGDQVIRMYQAFSDAYVAVEDFMNAFSIDKNLKSLEMRYSNEKV